MDTANNDGGFAVPFNAYRISLPQDLLPVYRVNNPAAEALIIESEKGRSVFAEALMKNPRLGTLRELCISALARAFGVGYLPIVAKDLRTMRVFYDSIDVESPLEHIYKIEDFKFWKRVVLAKTSYNAIQFKDDTFDWKSLGISLKYVELVEECPVESWPEEKMKTLATLVKGFVRELHIRKLQQLRDISFERYLGRDSDTDKSDSTDVSPSTSEAAVSVGDREELSEEEQEHGDVHEKVSSETVENAARCAIINPELELLKMLQAEWNSFDAKRAEEKQKIIEERKAARRARRKAQQERRDWREKKLKMRRDFVEEPKPQKIRVKNVFDLPIDEPEDFENNIVDTRNIELLLKDRKHYNYPSKHCYHIDLGFVRLFDFLEEFSIAFHPPELKDKFHSRYFKFSYNDIQRLASGIRELESLRIFRLRETQIDEPKLRLLTSVLKNMNVEVIDFGYNFLRDDCDDAIYELFENNTITLKSLELEGNLINVNVLKRLAFGLRQYGGHLEYLGLARNPLDDDAIHTLCKLLPRMEQVEHLNLTGVKLSPNAVTCCIVNELLGRNKTLRKLDLVGVPIDKPSAEEIIKAMELNFTIEDLNCRGCGLPFKIECNIEVCLRRNRYVKNNPYIGDEEKTEQEIKAFVQRETNLLLKKVAETVKARRACFENQPDIAERYSALSINDSTMRRYGSTLTSGVSDNDEMETPKHVTFFEEQEKFVFEPNTLRLEEFHRRVLVPGAGERYDYFKTMKERALCSRNE